MRYSVLLLMTSCLLAGCTSTPKEVPACSGNTLRGCKPVVYFASGSSALSGEAKSNLDWVYEKLIRFPRENVTVTGYTDSVGDAERNFSLSKQRAAAVKDYFVKKGIASDRIDVAFQGEFEPVCTKANCQYLNRRVELALSKPNSGWVPVDWKEVSAKMGEFKCFLCEEE